MHKPHSGLANTVIVQSQQLFIFNLNSETQTYDEANTTMAATAHTTSMSLTQNAQSGFVGGLVAKVKAYAIYRKSLNELRALSNRELADLGLSRSMIKRVALEAAYDNI
ncbi:DUF1127 domain-containing protein [Tritonibacter litoralis]